MANFDWAHPGPAELAIAAEFIQSEDQKELHAVFARPADFDSKLGKFVPPCPYRQLESILKVVLPAIMGFQVPAQSTPEGWETMCNQILNTQRDYTEKENTIWHKIWYGMGEASEIVNVWIDLIPDEFGLAVVKTGLAVIFKLAAKSADKRAKIFRAFEEVKKALVFADPEKMSFQVNAVVAAAADSLYQAIVDSIEDLILLTTNEKSTWRRMLLKLEHRKNNTDVDTILQNLSEKTVDFKQAVDVARDQTIESTGRVVRLTALQTAMVHRDVKVSGKEVTASVEKSQLEIKSKVESESRESRMEIKAEIASLKSSITQTLAEQAVASTRWVLERDRARLRNLEDIEAKNETMKVLLEARRTKEENAWLRRENERLLRRGPVISPQRFCENLLDVFLDERNMPDATRSLDHPNEDLDHVLMYRGQIRARDQSHVQSLLRHDRFLSWLNDENPDLILVNANIRSSGMEGISAISVFCANFITSLLTVRPEDVVVHYFCGLHNILDDDLYPGPIGLVRSLILQLFLKLEHKHRLSLEFINHRDYAEALREHDLETLCHTLHQLLYQFPPDMQVYCIIDTVPLFDTSEMYDDLVIVLDCLRDIRSAA
ncbi:hypothetical protein VSDG_03101 [Cytospora chrysosperma]|uniref:Uncharacterized protein n=1 Tax=Cytospora chrysosperma TaxID=252740 RepID=A0A423W8H6_CYTCH|nr:hypothetical protein VSDG_03101 [Valsa sordida]